MVSVLNGRLSAAPVERPIFQRSVRSVVVAVCGTVCGSLAFSLAFNVAACAEPKAVVELFTSQGCSSCPPADKLLGELAKDPSYIVLSLPIDYWDYLGWKDTLADKRFTARQKAYSLIRGDREVYTPQAVINGRVHALGSDRASIERAVTATANDNGVMSVPISVQLANGQLNVSVSPSPTAPPHGEIWLWSVAKAVPITIGRGENNGRQITYHNVVRGWLKVGDWHGAAESWSVPIENVLRDGVDAVVVYIQDGNREKPGPMLGATYATLH
jgi:hypothetical protein